MCVLLGNGGWIPGQDSGKPISACSGGSSIEPSYVPDILQLQSCILSLQTLPSHSWHASDNCFFLQLHIGFCSIRLDSRTACDGFIKGLICPVFCLSLSCFSSAVSWEVPPAWIKCLHFVTLFILLPGASSMSRTALLVTGFHLLFIL